MNTTILPNGNRVIIRISDNVCYAKDIGDITLVINEFKYLLKWFRDDSQQMFTEENSVTFGLQKVPGMIEHSGEIGFPDDWNAGELSLLGKAINGKSFDIYMKNIKLEGCKLVSFRNRWDIKWLKTKEI